MDALDVKRCRHCVSPTATIQIEDERGFSLQDPVHICYRCDRLPHPEDAAFVPPLWV
jgi:hypothetical protein